MSYLKGKYTSY